MLKKKNSKISSQVINGVTGGNRKRKYLRVLTCKHLDPPATPPTLPKNLIQNPLVVILFPISDTFLITVIYIFFFKKGKWLVTACEKKTIMAIYWIPNICIYIINFIRVVNLKFYLCMALRFFPIISYHLSWAPHQQFLNMLMEVWIIH